MLINIKNAISKLWQCFWEPIDNFLSRVGLLLVAKATHIVLLFVALALAVMFSDSVACYLQELLGRIEKYDVLKTIGFCVAGVLLVWQAGAANKRAKAMEDAAKEQANATKNTEAGQRQERLKNAIEHLGHDRDSVRMGGAYELFHLAKDIEDWRKTVLDILCAHIRQTTRGDEYKEKHEAEPSEEIQSLLTLLFRDEHDVDVFEDCSINLQGSYLNGANLSQARLRKVNLIEVQLQDANLSGSQLQGDLREAQLQRADLIAAQLQGAGLSNAQLQKAVLWETQLQEADLSGAELQGADLSGAELQGASLSEAKLQGADLSGAELQGASLSEAKLQRADLSGAELQGASLSGAELQGANLIAAQMQGANLRYTQLQGANLKEAQLQGADLYKAQLQGVSNQEKYPPGFESNIRKRIGEPSDLTGIIFAGGLKQEGLETLCEGLSAEEAQALREKLIPHVGQPISNELPSDSNAVIGTYTQEEAEQWIAEYNKAMSEAPRAGDSYADSAPDSGKDKGD